MAASAEISDFIPVQDWPNLEELAVGYHENLMPESHKLSGKHFDHVFDNGWRISHEFVNESKLVWKILEGEGVGLTGEAEYKSFEVRSDIFFVDFYKPEHKQQVTMVLDITTGQTVVGVSGFSDESGKRRTWTNFVNAVKDDRGTVQPYLPTEELIGKHVLYRYNPRDAYEHLYLNKGTLVWHAVSGTEKGLADAERCKMLKLRDSLYLLFWTETVMPVESIVVVDLEEMRSTGRFFCWDPKPDRAVHMQFGSYATILGQSNIPAILAKPPVRR